MAAVHAARVAVEADLAGILALYAHLHPGDPPPDPVASRATWLSLLDSTLTKVLLVDAGGIVASTCMLAVIPTLTRGVRPFAVIENVVTHPGHRRAGLGRAVLVGALDRAWKAGCYKVMLATGSSKPETLRFYAAAGFMQGCKTHFEARRPART